MPKVDEQPKNPLLKPYEFHGIVLTGQSGNDQHYADCPFCGKEGKFYVNATNGLWDCKPCGERGNIKEFFRKFYAHHQRSEQNYEKLIEDRKIISPDSFEEWGFVKHEITNEWMVPGYVIDSKGAVRHDQLYLWRKNYPNMKMMCPTYQNSDDKVKNGHTLYLSKWNKNKQTVYILEGVFDAVAFDEILKVTRKHDDGSYSHASKVSESLYKTANVIATPGANVFHESWCYPLSGKDVVILFDNDHRTKTDKDGSGLAGVKRISSMLSGCQYPPSSISYLMWGEKDQQWTDSLKSGYDVRDYLSQADTDYERVPLLGELLDKVRPVPDEWMEKTKEQCQIVECTSWSELESAWKQVMYWHDGLGRALPFMLAVAVSTPIVHDQLFGKVVAPPSSGKTELVSGLSTNKIHTITVDIFTGLHSGVKTEGGEDISLMAKVKNKCLIISDADTVKQCGNLEKVLSEFRRGYDRNSSTNYRNGVANNYENHSFTTLWCGTHELDNFDKSGLGQRFLDCVISKGVDPALEYAVNMKAMEEMDRVYGVEPIMNGKGPVSEEMQRVKQMTGGYLYYLLQRIEGLFQSISRNTSLENKIKCGEYAKFVAKFRSRPSDGEQEQEEQSTRLCKQHYKLAYCLAAVFGKDRMDDEVLNHVRMVAIDTARGSTLNIAHKIMEHRDMGIDSDTLSQDLLKPVEKVLHMLTFMRKIGIVEKFSLGPRVSMGTRVRYRLTESVSELYNKVMGVSEDV